VSENESASVSLLALDLGGLYSCRGGAKYLDTVEPPPVTHATYHNEIPFIKFFPENLALTYPRDEHCVHGSIESKF